MTTTVAIGDTFEGKALALVVGDGQKPLNWAQYPVQIPSGELAAMKHYKDKVLAVLQNTLKAPSVQAGLQKVTSTVIKVVDKEFRAAQADYEKRLMSAEGEDLKIIRDLEQRFTVKDYGGWFGWVFSVLETFGASYKSQSAVAKEGSYSRIGWLHQVHTLEPIRFNVIKAGIENNIEILLENLKKRGNAVDLTLLRQIYEVTEVYQVIFPDSANEHIAAAKEKLAAVSKENIALITAK